MIATACMQEFQSCDGPALVLSFLESCGDIKLMESGLRHMHKACSSNQMLCTTWGALCGIRLALAIAGEGAWPERVRRTALLLTAVLCRGSADAAQHFLQLEVNAHQICQGLFIQSLPSWAEWVCYTALLLIKFGLF